MRKRGANLLGEIPRLEVEVREQRRVFLTYGKR
jgi:hypothetical protein